MVIKFLAVNMPYSRLLSEGKWAGKSQDGTENSGKKHEE